MEKATYYVVAAAICFDERILCLQKGRTKWTYTSYKWEFPGGKVEDHESEEQALIRELREEMEYEVLIDAHFGTFEYDYPDLHVVLSLYYCHPKGNPTAFVLKEHLDSRWLLPSELDSLDWVAADEKIIQWLRRQTVHIPELHEQSVRCDKTRPDASREG